MTKAVERKTNGAGNVKLVINQLLAQLQKRNQRLAHLRNENQQLTLELAQRRQELLLAQDQIQALAAHRSRAAELEIERLEIQEQLHIRDGKIRELQRQADKSKALSIRLAEKEGAFEVLSVELAELQLQARTEEEQLQSQVRSAAEKSDLLATQLVETQNQLTRIRETLGWRLLSKFGRIKYGILLPVYRRFRKGPDSPTAIKQDGVSDH